MVPTFFLKRLFPALLSLLWFAALTKSASAGAGAGAGAGANDNLRRWSNSKQSLLSAGIRKRSLVMFGTIDDWMLRQQQNQQEYSYHDYPARAIALRKGVLLAASKSTRKKARGKFLTSSSPHSSIDDDDSDSDDEEEEFDEMVSKPQQQPQQQIQKQQDTKPKNPKNKIWPPYPFNLLQRDNNAAMEGGKDQHHRKGPALRAGGAVWSFFHEQVRVSGKQLATITSRLWFHLPPSIPPLIVLTMIPRQEQQIITNIETGLEQVVSKTVFPLISNPLARGLVLGGFSLAIMSWAHSELNRLRKLEPLPLNPAYRNNLHSAILPTFLPEEVPDIYMVGDDDDGDDIRKEDLSDNEEEEEENSSSPDSHSKISQKLISSVPPKMQRHLKKQFASNGGSKNSKRQRTPMKSLRRMREARKRESQKIRRMQIYDELVALQAIKRKAKIEQQQKQRKKFGKYYNNGEGNGDDEIEPLGYALVTGASRGIGRAIAVELARWEIPLILVARDLTRLTSLAYDLEACYGVKCCVIQADLSKPHVAEQIHLATSRAGLRVDVLVNNAGVSHNGLAVDMPIEDVDTAIMTNVNSVAKLTHLYGKDMKEKRRGRILMVSSVVGAVSAGPTVALYAATKSFEKMLGLSIAKELEPYGVGVTCLMPGAVRDTDFRTRSKSHEAICWKIPFYTKAPSEVAKLGVRSLLRGDVEVTPGILNRVFLKVLKPGMPQRLHNIIVEMAWNPLQIPPFLKIWQSEEKRQKEREMQLERRYKDGYDEAQEQDKELKRSEMQEQTWQPRYNSAARGSPPPLMLVVPEERSSPPPQQQETVARPITQPDAQNKHMDGGNASEPIAAPPSKIDANATEDKIKKSKDEYAALRNLQGEFDSDSDDISPSIPSPEAATNNSDPSTSSTISAPQSDQSPDSYQRLPEQQQSSSAMSQLQEQVRQLQEKVQDQERQQFLQQLEQQRQQRELEFEKRELERQKKEQREEVEARQKEHQEEQKQRHGSKKPNEGSWIKRKPQRRTTDRPQDSKDKKPTKKEKPTVIQQDTDKDILTESLEHPLLSRL